MKAKKPRENRVPIMMAHDELAAIDRWRFDNHIATRSDAVRRLCHNALYLQEAIELIAELSEQVFEAMGTTLSTLNEVQRQISSPSGGAHADETINEVGQELLDIYQIAEMLLLHILQVNNTIVPMMAANSFAQGKLESRKGFNEAQKVLDEFESRLREIEENKLLVIATSLWSPETRTAYKNMTDAEQNEFLLKQIENLRRKRKKDDS